MPCITSCSIGSPVGNQSTGGAGRKYSLNKFKIADAVLMMSISFAALIA
jgi:hypothetical protein